MLKELKLQNYRGFYKHTIRFKDLNVIVGINNAGKSTVVEALRISSFAVNRYRNLSYKKIPQWLDIGGINYGVSPSLKYSEINFDSICNQYNNNEPAVITVTFSDGNNVTTYLNDHGDIHSVIESSKGKIISSRSSANTIDLPAINILPQVGPVQRDEVILDRDYIKSAIGSSLSPLHFRNQLNVFYDLFPKFQELVESTWTGVLVHQLTKENNFPKTPLYLEIRNENFVAELSAMGHGLQMWLQVMWFLTLFDSSEIIILDEPDVYMHADLQRRLIRLIKHRFPQIIVTSHSVEIMAEVEPDEILIVDKSAKKSKFAINIPAVQRVVESTGSIHNINLARLWRAKKFILVEGKDVKYFKIIQDKFFPNSPLPFDSIPNMPIGGWSGWNYAIGSSMLLLNAFKERITIYCILDSDYHTEKIIKERYDETKKKEINLHIWHRKEIENYFVVPEAFQRIISKRSKRKHIPSLENINIQLDNISSSLEDNITDSFANELFLENKSKGLQYANRKARKFVKKVAKNDGNLLTIISGKEILTQMSKWSQDNFQVSFSYTAILNEIRKSEINEEVISIVSSIETESLFKTTS